MSKKVLITGGEGFIGRNLTERLREFNYEVYTTDIVGDPTFKGLLPPIPIRFDVIYHLAAVTSVHNLDHAYVCSTNQQLAIEVAKYCNDTDSGGVIHTSSSAVYGEPSNKPLTEGSQLSPLNPYGESKILAEQALQKFCKKRVLSVRLSNVIGKYQRRDQLLYLAAKAAKEQGSITIYGTTSRAYTPDYYVCECLRRLGQRLQELEGVPVLNYGSQRPLTVRKILEDLFATMTSCSPPRYYLTDARPYEMTSNTLDLTKLRQVFSQFPIAEPYLGAHRESLIRFVDHFERTYTL